MTEPADGTVVSTESVTIRGTSSPDWAGVYRVLSGGGRETVRVADDGDWTYVAKLREGRNMFRFHLDSAYGQSDVVTILYRPASAP